jgi:hypothetical protein
MYASSLKVNSHAALTVARKRQPSPSLDLCNNAVASGRLVVLQIFGEMSLCIRNGPQIPAGVRRNGIGIRYRRSSRCCRSQTANFFDSTKSLEIGNNNVANIVPGYMDEIRNTKGVARYAGAFTPSISEFPNSQMRLGERKSHNWLQEYVRADVGNFSC